MEVVSDSCVDAALNVDTLKVYSRQSSKKTADVHVEQMVEQLNHLTTVEICTPDATTCTGTSTCAVCFDALTDGQPLLACPDCGTPTCASCLFTYVRGSAYPLCLNSDCRKPLAASDLEKLHRKHGEQAFPQWLVERQWQMDIEKALVNSGTSATLMHCPGCRALCVPENASGDEKSVFRCKPRCFSCCPLCHTEICLSCKATTDDCTCRKHVTEEDCDCQEDFESLAFLSDPINCKRCPGCEMIGTHFKFHGCHHITCQTDLGGCGAYYCYLCLQDLHRDSCECPTDCYALECDCPDCPGCGDCP